MPDEINIAQAIAESCSPSRSKNVNESGNGDRDSDVLEQDEANLETNLDSQADLQLDNRAGEFKNQQLDYLKINKPDPKDEASNGPINLDDLRISAVKVDEFDARSCFKSFLEEKYGKELVEKTIELATSGQYDVYLED